MSSSSLAADKVRLTLDATLPFLFFTMIRRDIEPQVTAAGLTLRSFWSPAPGTRQTGKTTLARAQSVGIRKTTFVALDDFAVMATATHVESGEQHAPVMRRRACLLPLA